MDMTPIQEQAFGFFVVLVFAAGTIFGCVMTHLVNWLTKDKE